MSSDGGTTAQLRPDEPKAGEPDTQAPTTAGDAQAARVPKYYGLKRHLLQLTETQPAGTPVPRSARWPRSSTPRAPPSARRCRSWWSRAG